MTDTSIRTAQSGTQLDSQVAANPRRRRPIEERGQWGRFVLMLIITAIVIVPIIAVVYLSTQPVTGLSPSPGGFSNFLWVLNNTNLIFWLENSLMITFATMIVAVIVAAPAGYVISRVRNRWVSGYSLVLFIIQSLPVVTAIIPLFILFTGLHLVDNLGGVVIIYVGGTISVATWMFAAYFDSIPIDLEEAAWIDGLSVAGSFLRVVLRNSLPGILSTAIFSFLLSWNDYLVAAVFLRSDVNLTLPVGLESFFTQFGADWGHIMTIAVVMMLPPIIVFAALNRYFSIGGIGGSLAGR